MTDNPAGRTQQQRLARATPWVQDDEMEALIRLRQTNPVAFEQLAPKQWIQLGFYERARDNRHDILGGDAA